KHNSRVRNAIQHHNQVHHGTRQALEQYASLVESLITGRERSFAGAEIPNELYEASMAALGMESPAKQRPVDDTPRPEPARPAAAAPSRAQQRPAPAPTRSRNAAMPSRRAAPERGGPPNSTSPPARSSWPSC
ncbi:MAG TPA: hypothetical protein VF897_01070, partial [Roseiflexaceae bacterium]